jgi:hypothetical protein
METFSEKNESATNGQNDGLTTNRDGNEETRDAISQDEKSPEETPPPSEDNIQEKMADATRNVGKSMW